MIDWIPIVFVTFKVVVFGTCMFLAIKWHHDQGKKWTDKGAMLRAGGKVAAVFMLALLVLGLLTFALANMLDLDLSLP